MKTHFELSPADYEQRRHGAVEDRRRVLLREAIGRLQPRVKRVLELGCGPGWLLDDLAADYPAIAFAGIDVSPAMIEHAGRNHRRPNLCYEASDITVDPRCGPVDFMFSIDLLHHIHRTDEFLVAAAGLLEESGVWTVIEPNVYHPFIYCLQERMRRAGVDEDHFRPWIVEPLMIAAGLSIASRGYASLFPGCFRSLPRFVAWVERRCENWRFTGGSVVYTLVKQTAEQSLRKDTLPAIPGRS